MFEMIKAIIFDLGSVYFNIDWFKIDEEMRKKFNVSSLVMTSYGKEIREVYDKVIRGEGSLKDVFKKICEGKPLEVDEVSDYYKNLYKSHKITNEKIKKLVENLKSRFKIACFTNTNDIHFQTHEEEKNLEDFDYVFASFKIGKSKEDEGAFDEMLDKMNLMPEEVVLIDDSGKNIENAMKHGLNAIKYENYEQLINDLNKLGVKIKNDKRRK